MNPTVYAMRLGVRRGWTEFLQSLRSPQDQGFYLFMGIATLGYLWLNRNSEVEGTGLLMPTYALPSLLAALLAFGVVIGPAFALSMEREDGTLLRHKSLPNGMTGYVTGQLVFQTISLLPLLLIVLIPSLLLFDGVMQGGATGWPTTIWVVALGLLATMPIGMMIGALVPSSQKVGTWGMLPVMVVTAISGIFFPIQALWGWVQVVAQVFPTYWIGLGLRSAFLPDSAAALELGGTWRPGMTALVLSVWAIAGLLATPRVLRRMARRQSGSQMAASKEASAQVIR